MNVEPTIRMVELGQGRAPVEVWQAGQGTPLVFLHGAGGLMPDDRFFQALAGQFHVHAPLLPGYGGSEGEDELKDMLDTTLHTGDVIDALGLTGAALVGHSMGGMIAAELAALAPNDVSRLALIAPAGLWLDDHPVEDLFAKLPFELPELLFHDVALGESLLTAGLDLEDPAFLSEFLIGNARRLGMAGKLLFPIPDRGLSRRLHRIKARTLILWGASDRLISPVYGDAFAAAIPNSELEIVAEAGHLVTLEKPGRVVDAIATLVNAG
ncbi:MAG: alpha/beta fold hydrolase [Alphaproteobacteria bacterium]|nr:alpha/beta fold hydrolase [Alphaproteobacteria bacterium]